MEAVQRFLSFSVFQMPLIKILLSLAIIFVFLLAQKPSSRAIVKAISLMLRRFTKVLEESMLKVLEMPVRLLFVILGFLFSIKILNLPKPVDAFFIHLIRTLVLFSIFWMVYRLADIFSSFFQKYADKTETKLDDMLMPFFSKGLKTITIILSAVFVLQEWEFNIAGILTGLGLGGLAFALAAKDTLSNLFGSVMIMIDRPFIIGDWIMTSHVEGVVEEIGFRSTRIRTFAQAVVSIPNSIMSNEPITSWQNFMQIQEDVNMKIMRILENLKLSVAFPSRTVYIEK